MGGVGKAIKKFVKNFSKIFKKINPIDRWIFRKLGLSGKTITHTYLMVQPLHSGYRYDPIKTIVAEAIGLDVDLPEYLVKSLQKGAGIDLMRYYHYQRIRIKKYNMTTTSSVVSGIGRISKEESDKLVVKYAPEYKDTKFTVMALNEFPSETGAYWAYIKDMTARLETVHVQRSPINPVNPKKQVVVIDEPTKTMITIDSKLIEVLQLGSMYWTDKEGNKKESPLYFGFTDLGTYQNGDIFYFYDPMLSGFLDKTYSYIIFQVEKLHEEKPETEEKEGTEGTEESTDETTEESTENNTEENTEEDTEEDEKEKLENRYKLDHYLIIYGNETENKDFYNDIIKFTKNDEYNDEAIEHKYFQFYQALPLKYKSKHTIGFKDGDPYNGAYDPDKYLAREKDKLRSIEAYIDDPDILYPEDDPTTPEYLEALKRQQDKVNKIAKSNAANKDSDTSKPPRIRNTTPAGYVKPRKINMRLRRKIKKTVTASELRKYEQAAKLLGENYEALVGQLIHSEQDRDNPEVHHSYILPSVTLNTKVQEVKEYWYTFMKRMYSKVHKGKPVTVNFDFNSSDIRSMGENKLNELRVKGTLPNTNEFEFEVELQFGNHNKLLYPSTHSLTGSTINNTVDPLIFSLSYTSMVRFKIKGDLKDKKKTRKKPYYDIKMGRTNNEVIIKVKIKATNRGTERNPKWEYSAIGSGVVIEASENDFSFTTEYKYPPTGKGLHGVFRGYRDTIYDPDYNTYTCFCKQIGDSIDIIAVRGLHFLSTVHDKGVSMSAQQYLLKYGELEKNGFYNMFTMPICYKTLRSSGLISNTRFAARSIQRLDYSTKDQYIPWYARKSFKIVLNIVQVVLFIVTIWSGGWGATLAELGKQAAAAVLKQVLIRLAIAIAINVAVSAVIKALSKVFGAKFAAVVGTIAAVALAAYGVSDVSGIQLPLASQVFMVAPAIINGAVQALSAMQENVQAMIEREQEAFKKATEKLEEDKQYFIDFVNSDIDPQAFVSALTQRVERLDDFITRTLQTNMNQFADLEYLTDSIDASLVIDYTPNLDFNWTGVPTDSSVENEPVNI